MGVFKGILTPGSINEAGKALPGFIALRVSHLVVGHCTKDGWQKSMLPAAGYKDPNAEDVLPGMHLEGTLCAAGAAGLGHGEISYVWVPCSSRKWGLASS